MEVYLDPDKDILGEKSPIILTQFNLSKAIKDNILANFEECGSVLQWDPFWVFDPNASFFMSKFISKIHEIVMEVKYVNPITKLCIIRASRDDHTKVWSAITVVKSIGSCPVVFNRLHISRSIKACKEVALKCEESKFEQQKLAVGEKVSEDEVQQMKNHLEKLKALEH